MEGKRKRIYRWLAACLALLVAFTGLLTVQAAGVAKPTKLSAKVNDNVSITLQWTAAKKVSGYQVYTAGSKSGKYTLLATTSATKYTHGNLKGGKTYYYKVRAYKTVKKKKQYSGYTAVVQATAVQYAAQKSLQSLNSKVDGMIRRLSAGRSGHPAVLSADRQGFRLAAGLRQHARHEQHGLYGDCRYRSRPAQHAGLCECRQE